MLRAKFESTCFGLIGIVMLAVLAACTVPLNIPPSTPTPPGMVQIDSLFRDLFTKLGGEDNLGYAISKPLPYPNGILCQYTLNAKLCFNPAGKTDAERFYLERLVWKFTFLKIPPLNAPPPVIYEGFVEMYKQFSETQYAGAVVTEVFKNLEKGRLEQYFERVGFYTLLNDPQKTVHLLSYGALACSEECSKVPPGVNAIDPKDTRGALLFAKIIDRLGGYGVFGSPISVPYLAKDGNIQQVLENIVIYMIPTNPQKLNLRHLPLEMNMPRANPGPRLYGIEKNMVFHVIKDNLGFHIPIWFDQFIAQHGGKEISGAPLSEPYELVVANRRVARQCFENYCLDFLIGGNSVKDVSMVPLGVEYLKTQDPSVALKPIVFSRSTVTLMPSKLKPEISTRERQTIQLVLSQKASQPQPISGVESIVSIEMPNGKIDSFWLPPTDINGISEVILPALENAQNGHIIFTICLKDVSPKEAICASDSFMVWNYK
jgi:hypothetical protein